MFRCFPYVNKYLFPYGKFALNESFEVADKTHIYKKTKLVYCILQVLCHSQIINSQYIQKIIYKLLSLVQYFYELISLSHYVQI